MKKIAFFLIVAFLSVSGNAQKNAAAVQLRGTLKNFSNQVEVEDMSDLQYLLPPTSERMIVPDSSGKFSIKFTVPAPNYFRLGRNILYLSPGDDLTVLIDRNDPRIATFTGKGSAPNLYLRNTPFPKGGSFMEAGRNTKKIPQATVDTLTQIAAARKKELAAVTGITPEFRRLEEARIKADFMNSLQSGNSYRPRMSKDSLAAYMEEYQKLIRPLLEENSKGFTDASLMKLVVYRDVADEVLKQPGKETEQQQIKDWMAAYRLNDEMKKVSDKQALSAFKDKVAAIKTGKYRNALNISLQNLMKFGKGDVAVDFAAVDLSGKKVNLSSLKGKVIYVDLWATWCGPCLAEMPHFDSIKLKYKDNPGVAFVSLSIDDVETLWKNNIEKRKADGIQWLINRNKLDAYNIVTIPRTLLIDKDFKVVSMNAPVPSSKELTEVIDKLIKS